MRLKQINLAGFKSFVDPTQIPVPGQLVGVVGPNGCGKSNIIDAVRWVLGESSAKHLRGATMQDVLFNGSGDRKPVNRATVELVFDNSLGKAAGQWSTYAEISVKRMLERDGDSTYFINNTRVRRRDVSDIFLGTGLGSRAYAIIEQGMISRVIEAKPEELRVFLEEAAGVSKYKERRRETELRLKDTRENLARVEDIRQELDKQLTHLQGQAEVATRYHALQAQLTGTQLMLWFTRRQEASATRARHARDIERLGNELEAETAALRDAERRLEDLRNQHYKAGDEVHAAQGALYETNAEVSRIEQQIAHIQDNQNRVQSQINALSSQLSQAEQQQFELNHSLAQWQDEANRAQDKTLECAAIHDECQAQLPLAEEAWRASIERRDALQQVLGQAQQSRQVEQTKLDHSIRVLEGLQVRNDKLHEEQNALERPDADILEGLRNNLALHEEEANSLRDVLADKELQLPQLEAALVGHNEAVELALQTLTGMEARAEAMQQLQDRLAQGADIDAWIEQQGLDGAVRLWQGITIDSGYEDALEAVLRERLNAVGMPELDQCGAWVNAPMGKLAVVEMSDNVALVPNAPMPANAQPLRRFVNCRDPRWSVALAEWLHGVFVVQTLEQALPLRAYLEPGAMIVTCDGYLLTRHTMSFYAPDSELHGVLSRQREIEQLQTGIAASRVHLDALRVVADTAASQIHGEKVWMTTLREQIGDLQLKQHGIDVEIVRLSEQTQRLMERDQQISLELMDIAQQIESEAIAQELAQTNLSRFSEESAAYAAELDSVLELYRETQAQLDQQRLITQQAERAYQEAVFNGKTSLNKIAEVERGIAQTATTVERLGQSLSAEQLALRELDDSPWQDQLQQLLTARVDREQSLAQCRDILEATETELKSVEQERLSAEQKLNPLRDRIGDIKLKEQEARISEEQYAEQLLAAGANEEELLQNLEKGTRSGSFQAEINRLNDEIKSLGAVNLAALEELTAAQERKTYLDAQFEDLTAAMNTLEEAIRRIDRETRDRLQATFDEVNGHFSEMFPALFNGGNAKLLLTGEEILDCGVQVIAQPPGKKNSSIHLLSGGEKALTAVALVFSIFKLNPAPFCMLDEVDAPLDDTNTVRFCELVKKMSDHSQFVFISHNKITMELANQLLGITMQEPGISRVVAVDIESAMKLTESVA